MFARITSYRLKAERIDPARAALEAMKAEIMALPGLHRLINVVDEEGAGYIITLVENREATPTNREKIDAIWARFGEFLDEAPVVRSYAVIADWG